MEIRSGAVVGVGHATGVGGNGTAVGVAEIGDGIDTGVPVLDGLVLNPLTFGFVGGVDVC